MQLQFGKLQYELGRYALTEKDFRASLLSLTDRCRKRQSALGAQRSFSLFLTVSLPAYRICILAKFMVPRCPRIGINVRSTRQICRAVPSTISTTKPPLKRSASFAEVLSHCAWYLYEQNKQNTLAIELLREAVEKFRQGHPEPGLLTLSLFKPSILCETGILTGNQAALTESNELFKEAIMFGGSELPEHPTENDFDDLVQFDHR